MANGLQLVRASRPDPWAFPLYSDAVCQALSRIREVHAEQEAKLQYEERRELAEALQVLALAAHLESQIAAHGAPVHMSRPSSSGDS